MAGNQRGTSALLVAASLSLLMGMAAIGVDLGSGFNTRRQNQTAADLAATSGAVFSASEAQAVTAALVIARENMPTTYTAAEWQSLWQSCVDPSRPSGYLPLDDPWSAGKLNCISAHPADNGGPQLRVRIPDQVTATSFGRILGMTNFLTRANAHATFRFVTDGAMVPFGVLNGTPTGTEQCVVQPSPGLLAPPCDGPNSGNFGTMEVPAWGNTAKQTTVECNRSSQDLFAQNVAIGSDHVVLVATGPDGTPASFPGTGGPHPDDGGVPYPADYAKEDACNSSSGEAVATDPVPVTPLNTVDTNTGSASDAIKLGLIGRPNSEPVFPGGLEPRLRRTVNGHTLNVREKDGSDQVEYVIDNTPLWEYLRAPGELGSDGIPLTGNDEGCNRNYIATRSWPDNRAAFMACLQAYEGYRMSVPDPKPLFTDALGVC